ncbi:hypothetical protein CCMA1212_001544 [Trichoderma ghanense]|uniref:Uncharacterized protein n=1 Tax=Trichoderma ghanense TaxID=65468 RepID=A0ABY2HDV4_9HYPO
MGINAAATSDTPRSVASRLNCAAAFLVSSISTLIPSRETCSLVRGLSGKFLGPEYETMNPHILLSKKARWKGKGKRILPWTHREGHTRSWPQHVKQPKRLLRQLKLPLVIHKPLPPARLPRPPRKCLPIDQQRPVPSYRDAAVQPETVVHTHVHRRRWHRHAAQHVQLAEARAVRVIGWHVVSAAFREAAGGRVEGFVEEIALQREGWC